MNLKEITIPPEAGGMQVADFVRRLLPDLPESMVRKLFDARDVRLDGVRVARDSRLAPGQQLRLYLPSDPAPSLDIVYEDRDVLLVNKRAGLPVEPVPGALSLSELCRRHVLEAGEAVENFFPPAPCHRLDVRTGGLCLFAKNQQALDCLLEVFRSRTLKKEYIALVRGEMKPASAVCKAFLLKDAKAAKVRILDHPLPGAREIVTGYTTLESGSVSRLQVHLITGRTHQIRAHLAALGHPILGDDLYGDRDFNRRLRARSLKLWAVSLTLDTGGILPALDGREFSVSPPF